MLTRWILSEIFYIKPAIVGNELDRRDSTKYPTFAVDRLNHILLDS